MSNEIEALDALAKAGLAASELDKPSARRRVARKQASREARWWRRTDAPAVDGHVPGTCANCAAALIGEFCHACGQSSHVHRSVGHVFEEFLHGIWHFDSKAWRTLPLLVFRPGRLTWDYIHGHRARFIAPIALFLFSIFLMFFVFSFVGAPDFGGSVAKGSKVQTVAQARAAVVEIKAELAQSEADLAAAKRDSDAETVTYATGEVTGKRLALRIAEANVRRVATATGATVVTAPGPTWQDEIAAAARSGELKINSNIPGVDENIRKALENPDFALYRVQQKAYKLSFLLIPMSLPILWLLFFWRRETATYDHVVFTLYSLSFMSLLLVFAVLLVKMSGGVERWGGPSIDAIGFLLFVPPVHMFFQLKGGYRLSTGSALWRTVVLSQATIFILGLFATLIVVLGLAD